MLRPLGGENHLLAIIIFITVVSPVIAYQNACITINVSVLYQFHCTVWKSYGTEEDDST